ncbi:sialidase-like isoform X2 [Palaemon carinicauda]|uniref:sialidase-like isoform X2 n=1 Tax=Palaemon carinicauda TaxID=392227 RepID=UPI0035B5DE5F
MQVLTVIGRVLLAALAASAAKLPLPPQPSTLYEAPLEDLPVPAQTSFVPVPDSQVVPGISQVPAGGSQVPVEVAQVPAGLSTLYEAPVADLPSQSSIEVQSFGLPAPADQFGSVQVQSTGGLVPTHPEQSSGLPVPADQFGSVQVQSTGGLVPTHPELSTSLGLPSQTLSVSGQQPTGPITAGPVEVSQVATGASQVPVEFSQVLAEPSTLYEAPVADLPSQSSIQIQSSGLPVPADQFGSVQVQSTGGLVPTHPKQSSGLPVPADQFGSVQVQSTGGLVPTHPEQSSGLSVQADQFGSVQVQSTGGLVPTHPEPSSLGLPSQTQSVLSPQPTGPITAGPVEFSQVPAEPSTLYEAPVADLPSQSSILVQSSGLHAPADQLSSVQVQSTGGLVPTHSEPSVLGPQPTGPINAVPAESSAHQQPGLTHTSQGNILVSSDQTAHHASSTSTGPGSSVQIIPEPAVPSTLYDTPAEENLTPIHQSPSISTPIVNVPVAVEPTILQPITVDNTPFPVGHVHVPSTPEQIIPVFDEHIDLVQTHDDIVPVPNEPSTLYGVPDQDFQIHSQTSQASDVVLPEQIRPDAPAVVIVEESSDSHALLEPSGIYETPEADSALSLVQSSAGLPNNEGSSSVQSITQVNVPVAPLNPIQFPEQVASVFVPVPSVPSTLYETPLPSAPSTLYETPVAPGKSMDAGDNHQNEIPAASELVATVTKGGMMMGMPYNFQFGVDDDDSGAMFSHVERSDGKSTSGQYKVTLPDGRVQVVNFYDNGDGFHADISYE